MIISSALGFSLIIIIFLLSESLDFLNTITDDLFLTRLSEIQNLRLKKLCLTFNGCSKNIAYGFPCLVRSQRWLEYFDLTESNSVNDRMLCEIISHMKILKVLILNKCHNVTDNGIKEYSKLTKLQVKNETNNSNS